MILGREIPPTGNSRQGCFYILGEAPGQHEDRAGIPFVGASGNLLFRTLKQHGIDRSQCRVANVFWRRPPANDISKVKERYALLFENYKTRTLEDILATKPKCLLALGGTALQSLFPNFSIAEIRGFWLDWNGIPVMPTWHPAAVLREDSLWLSFVSDIQKACAKFLGTSTRVGISDIGTEVDLSPDNPDQFINAIKVVLQHNLNYALDIEVAQGNLPTMSLVGIAYRDPATGRITAVNTHPTAPVVDALRQLSQRLPDKAIFHNANFDLTWLYGQYGIEWCRAPHDTMVMHHILLPDQQKSLDFCASIWLDVPAWKHLREADPLFYNLMDNVVTLLLFEELERQLKQRGFWSVYNNQKRQELLPAIFMGYLGVRLNTKTRDRFRAELEARLSEIRQELTKLAPETAGMNLRSPHQVKRLLYEVWGIPPQTYRGKVSVNEEAIRKLLIAVKSGRIKLSEAQLNWILKWREWKEIADLISKELSIEPHPWTGCVHTAYNIVGTESARWSSSAPLWALKVGGANLQNRKKEFRAMYEPRFEDFVFIGADYSGAEAYIVAWRCNDEITKQAFHNGEDIHVLTASLMFGKDPEDITKEERSIGKRIRHAGNYGMSWKKLSILMEIPAKQAKGLLEAYHNAFPKVRSVFHRKTRELVISQRLITDAWGLPRFFTNLRVNTDDVLREALAFYPQSTCTHTLNKALLCLWEQTKDHDGVALQFQIHDEIVLAVRKDKQLVKEALQMLNSAMDIEIPIKDLETGKTLPLKLRKEFKLGLNWGEMLEFQHLDEFDDVWKRVVGG